MFGFIADLITAVVSILLPVFATYKALRTRDITTLTLWLIYWTTLALVLLAESQLYFFLRWVPLYSWIRLGVYVYLVAPGQKHGSFFIYKEYIHPFLHRHEQHIDQLINEGNTRAFTLGWELVTRGIGFVQAQVLAYNQNRFEMYAGRQPGLGNYDERRQIPSWDRRQSGRNSRFEEVNSDEDEHSYVPRETRRRQLPEGDLYLDGPNTGHYRQRRRLAYDPRDDTKDYDSDEEEYYRRARGIEFQTAVRDKEDTLIQSALSRIARARAKGKTTANLPPEEVEALERRRIQQPESSSALATPPATPTTAKAKLATRGSTRTSSSSKDVSKSSKKKQGSPSKSSSKSKADRKHSSTERMAEHALPYAAGTAPQGIMVPGPNGVPVYAPLVYGTPDQTRSSPSGSKSRSRSISKPSRRESTPPENYASPRYYPSAAVRPTSSASNRSLPDDPDWMPTRRSQPNVNGQYGSYRDEYDVPPLPAAQGRRHASGPADVRYSTPRRSAPLALSRPPGPPHSNSDPSMVAAKRSGLSREVTEATSSDDSDSSEDSSEEDQPVQVNVDIDSGTSGGYSITRAPATVAVSNRRKASHR